jgi:hypothetical protein
MVVSHDLQKNLASDSSNVHFPHFIFETPETVHSFQAAPIPSERPIRVNGYEDALPDELLRPPQSRSARS